MQPTAIFASTDSWRWADEEGHWTPDGLRLVPRVWAFAGGPDPGRVSHKGRSLDISSRRRQCGL